MSSPASAVYLLCLDLQPIFLKAMSDPARLQRRCAFAIQAATGLGVSVGFTEQVPEKLGGTTHELTDLAPGAKRFAKRTFSAFADDNTRDAIVGGGAQHLLLAGLETPVCVYQTALDALNAGVAVT